MKACIFIKKCYTFVGIFLIESGFILVEESNE